MDVLSDMIAATRVGRPGFGTTVRHAPWGRSYPKLAGAGFHMVLQGSCWLLPRQGDPTPLSVGDVVFLYGDMGHGLADSPETPLTEVAGPGEPQIVEGPGMRTALLCGVYEFERDWSHPLLDSLPEVVHVPAQLGRHPQLRAIVDLLTAELDEGRPGGDAVAPALLDALLVYILRAWLSEQDRGGAGWASALRDPGLAATLGEMHEHPGRQWTVEELAAHAGMSRATFARRFTADVGESPLAYLTRWRMVTAARRLRGGEEPLSAVARYVGYSSEYAFAKAFKRIHGTAPGRYRREDAKQAAMQAG
ncbi:AraC family transcriptional regulator [Nocardiopsis ganjiahuensis]|uniref:AraC family transcriptional regulator n=1 Tax=Nocardiopsis ganjiahuensis TaxID=239984 RepID=UPI0005940362|nr:AraC family transcriptional regulator [Nocardiopsis ganjiahuensis]